MLPTPSLSHLTREDLEKIYEPAEDTFIFLDALEEDAALLKGTASGADPSTSSSPTAPRLVVEIGSGSGCVSTFLAQSILGPAGASFLCTDLNPHAAECTVRTGKANGGAHLEVVRTSMLAGLLSRLQGRLQLGGADQTLPPTAAGSGLIDVLLFNPPYVPTTPEEEEQAQREAGIAGAWAGGWTGTRLLDELIDDVDAFAFSAKTGEGAARDEGEAAGQGKLPKRGVEVSRSCLSPAHILPRLLTASNFTARIQTLLSPGGLFYFIAIKQNDPEGLVRRLRQRGLETEVRTWT